MAPSAALAHPHAQRRQPNDCSEPDRRALLVSYYPSLSSTALASNIAIANGFRAARSGGGNAGKR
eukprot:6137061-Pleurochrysis_carterae.AAC.1